MNMKKEYINIFYDNQEELKQNSASILTEKRNDYLKTFEELGFPTNDLEEYKYTDLRNALKKEYQIHFSNEQNSIDIEKSLESDKNFPSIKASTYVMCNHKVEQKEFDTKNLLPEGVIVDSLKVASEKYPELLDKYIYKLSDKEKDGLVALNGVFSQDGFFVYVPKNVQIEYPIQLVNLFQSEQNLMVNSRNLIILEENARANLLFYHYTANNSSYFVNSLTEVFVEQNAIYDNYFLENLNEETTHINTFLVEQQRSSNVLGHLTCLKNGITRNKIEVNLEGENCETSINGIFIGENKQAIDSYTSINHNVPHCLSNELFKYVLGGKSKGGFTGRLYVEKDAQKTEAYQTNKNIVLSNTAKAQTRPQLEIFADDVKCSHGATIGQLDDTALFYMQSRGIPLKDAKMLLMNAFTSDVIKKIRDTSIKEKIQELVEKKLKLNE